MSDISDYLDRIGKVDWSALSKQLVDEGKALAREAIGEGKDGAKAAWTEVQSELSLAARDLVDLTRRSVTGEDVARELSHVEAQIANWSWVFADKVRVRWLEILAAFARQVGQVLRGVAMGALGAL